MRPNPNARALGLDPSGHRYGFASPYEGPHAPSDHAPSVGRVPGSVLMVDFPDAPGQGQADAFGRAYALDEKYFDEVSSGRCTPTLEFHASWVHGPRRCGLAAGALRTGESFEGAAIRGEILARDATSFRVRVTRK